MKRSIRKACLILAICAAASGAYAANQTINSTTSIGSLGFTPSNKVIVKVTSATTGYVTESLHMSGSRMFGTDSSKSVIYWKDAAIDGSTPAAAAGTFDGLTAPTVSGAVGSPDFSTTSPWASM
jgi:hypothetical protein